MDEATIIGVERAFNPGFPPRFLDWHPFKQDTQLLAGKFDVMTLIMWPVIYDQRFWKSVDGPGMFCTIELLAVWFGKDAMIQTCLYRKIASRLKSHIEPVGRPTVGVNCFGYCWASDWQPVHKVDDNKVKDSVVYLYAL